MTVVIQSWWTPALAVLMLVVGLLAGYFGRPLVSKDAVPTAEIAAVNTPIANTPSATLPTNQTPASTAAVDPTMAAIASQQQLMDYLVSHTTHFEGDANAKVTIIEFSDYQ